MLGNLSKFQQIKIIPSTASDLVVTHSLGVVPKVIIVTSPETSEPFTAEGFFRNCILSDVCGAVLYHNKANHNIVVGGLILVANASNVTNGNYYVSTNQIKIHQASGNGTWSTSTEYTFDIYG